MLDHIFWDGLEDSNSHQVMGKIAEKTAVKYNLSRKVQDAYAQETCKRALQTLKDGGFEREIVSVPLPEGSIHHDEFPARLKLEKIERLKPAFLPEGTITAATSSSLADGAAAVALTRLSTARGRNFKPLALIRGVACHAQEPDWFTTAPIQAITKVASQVGWLLNEVDLFEVNEAFAVVPLAVMQALHIPHAKMNVLGGACAMGHPLGASGARILVTLLNALHQHQHKRGIAAICIGGGEALAVAVEVPDGSF
jgi:acetyl-CoA C-acetyltransferase